MITKLKIRLLTLILFVKYAKYESSFDDVFFLKRDCKKQAEGYYYYQKK